jgi:cysteine desulfurase
MATALEIFHADWEQRIQTIRALRDRLEQALRESCAPVVINGSREKRLPNTLNIAFPGLEGEALLVNFDLEGIACSLGSTCASGSAGPAPVLMAMGCSEDVYTSSVRLSASIQNTEAEIDEAARRISEVVTRLR